jgi:hypothetical protein
MTDMANVTVGNLVSLADATKRLGLRSTKGVLRYIYEGRLRATKVPGGREHMIDAASLAEFASKPRRRGNPNFSRKTA